MATIHCDQTLSNTIGDLVAMPAKVVTEGSAIVARNVKAGNSLARKFAQELSGPHGKNYFKRISSEMLGALEGEWGPHAGGVPVGGGWRHGSPNTELERSQDIIGPRFLKDVDSMVDGLFW